uniref:RVT_N domain-containing protein n=1 Tax=Ascaris lumbricoides TaxID=6252 RepID=A0A0M3HP93_ASCLU
MAMQSTPLDDGEICWDSVARKKQFRDTDEWKKKKSRLLTKVKAMGRLNLALAAARTPKLSANANYGRVDRRMECARCA